jgi:hypothetical protein
MATWRKNKGWGNLLPRSPVDINPTPNMTHDVSDTPYWNAYADALKPELVEAIGKQAEYFYQSLTVSGKARYLAAKQRLAMARDAKANLELMEPGEGEDEYQSFAERYGLQEIL